MGTYGLLRRAKIYRRMQLNDALIASYRASRRGYFLNHPVAEEKGEFAGIDGLRR